MNSESRLPTENKSLEKAEGKKKRPRGFAGDIYNQLKPLNTSDYFKQTYGQDNYTILLQATDDSHAAFTKIANGSVEVEDVSTKSDEIKNLKPQAKVATSYDLFLKLAMGKLKTKDLIKLIFARKLKIKGLTKVLRFVKYFKVLSFIAKEQRKKALAENASPSTPTDKNPLT